MGESESPSGPLFGGAAWPLGCQVGFLERPLDDVLRATEAWFRTINQGQIKRPLGHQPLFNHLLALAPLQMPAARQVVVGTVDRWTMRRQLAVGWGLHFLGWTPVESSKVPR